MSIRGKRACPCASTLHFELLPAAGVDHVHRVVSAQRAEPGNGVKSTKTPLDRAEKAAFSHVPLVVLFCRELMRQIRQCCGGEGVSFGAN